MGNRLVGLIGMTILAAHGCSGSNSTPGATGSSGGASSVGGNSGLGGATQPASTSACSSVTPCGGDVVGTWNVSSSCLTISGDYDVSMGQFGCKSVPATGSLQTTGTFIANGDGTYTDNT